MSTTLTCPECDSPADSGARFCSKCGATLLRSQSTDAPWADDTHRTVVNTGKKPAPQPTHVATFAGLEWGITQWQVKKNLRNKGFSIKGGVPNCPFIGEGTLDNQKASILPNFYAGGLSQVRVMIYCPHEISETFSKLVVSLNEKYGTYNRSGDGDHLWQSIESTGGAQIVIHADAKNGYVGILYGSPGQSARVHAETAARQAETDARRAGQRSRTQELL